MPDRSRVLDLKLICLRPGTPLSWRVSPESGFRWVRGLCARGPFGIGIGVDLAAGAVPGVGSWAGTRTLLGEGGRARAGAFPGEGPCVGAAAGALPGTWAGAGDTAWAPVSLSLTEGLLKRGLGSSWSCGSPSFSSASLRAFLCSCSEDEAGLGSPGAASEWRDSRFWGSLWKLLRLLFRTMFGGSFRGLGAVRGAGRALGWPPDRTATSPEPASREDTRGGGRGGAGSPVEPFSLAFWDMASGAGSLFLWELSDGWTWGLGLSSPGPLGRLPCPRCWGWESWKASGWGMSAPSSSRAVSGSAASVCLGSRLWLTCSVSGPETSPSDPPGLWLLVRVVLFLRFWFLPMWIFLGRL